MRDFVCLEEYRLTHPTSVANLADQLPTTSKLTHDKLPTLVSGVANTRCENEDEQPPPSDPSRLLAVFRAVPVGTQPPCRALGNRWTGPASPAAGNYSRIDGVTPRQSATHRPNLRTTAGVAERDTPGPRTTEAADRGTTTPLTRVRQPACCTPALKTDVVALVECGITDLDQDTLAAFPALKSLQLDSNNLTHVKRAWFDAISVSTETDEHTLNITHLCTQAWEASTGVKVALGGNTTLQIVPTGLDSLSQTFAVVVSDTMSDSANRSMSDADVHRKNISTFGHEEMINVTCHVDARGETYRHAFTAPVSSTPDGTVCLEKTQTTTSVSSTTETMTLLDTTKPTTLTTEVGRNQTNLTKNLIVTARPGKERCACKYIYVGIITGVTSVLAVVTVELVALLVLVVCVIRKQRRSSRQDNPPVLSLNRWVLGGAGGEDAPVNGSPVSVTDAATQTAESDLHQYDEIPDAYFNYYNTRPGVQNPYWEIPDEYYTDYVNTRTESYPDEVVTFYAAAANVALPSQTRQGGKHPSYNTVPRTRSLPQIHTRQRKANVRSYGVRVAGRDRVRDRVFADEPFKPPGGAAGLYDAFLAHVSVAPPGDGSAGKRT
ncbi:hypothetical protein Bbelb_345530 [Branchiostoma belcheri]|nr:hypothetical protein Bbelb_345530 [Branchiostoma belcheri]